MFVSFVKLNGFCTKLNWNCAPANWPVIIATVVSKIRPNIQYNMNPIPISLDPDSAY